MSRTVYLIRSGRPQRKKAQVSIFDRGFVMGDAVYEVTCDGATPRIRGPHGASATLAQGAADALRHQPRQMALNPSQARRAERAREWRGLSAISRGNAGDRDFHFPKAGTPPTVVLYTQSKADLRNDPHAETGITVVSVPDLRWHRRGIKTMQPPWPRSPGGGRAAGQGRAGSSRTVHRHRGGVDGTRH